jgi:hypothetical protein
LTVFRLLEGCYESHVGGNKITVEYNRVEKLTRDKEMEIVAKKRDFGKKFTSAHQTTIDILVPSKGEGIKNFYSGDIKGNLIAWKIDNFRSLTKTKV